MNGCFYTIIYICRKLYLFGDDFNLIWIVLLFFVIFTLCYGSVTLFTSLLPKILTDFFYYGKAIKKVLPSVKRFNIS